MPFVLGKVVSISEQQFSGLKNRYWVTKKNRLEFRKTLIGGRKTGQGLEKPFFFSTSKSASFFQTQDQGLFDPKFHGRKPVCYIKPNTILFSIQSRFFRFENRYFDPQTVVFRTEECVLIQKLPFSRPTILLILKPFLSDSKLYFFDLKTVFSKP